MGTGILLQDPAFCKQANLEIIGPFKVSDSGEIEENESYYQVDGVPFLGEDRIYLEGCVKNRDGLLRIRSEDDQPSFQGDTDLLARWLNSRPHPFLYLALQEYLGEDHSIKTIQKALHANREVFRDRASPYECAQFAVLAYDRSPDSDALKLPDGWELLTFSRTNENGYFGRAFVNHQTGNVVIAHCGTETSASMEELLQDFWTDLLEVLQGNIGPQQKSAVEFSRSIHKRVNPYGYRIGCVGHSLGGWLAQITTADLRWEQEDDQAYAVCLDSPGAKAMLKKYRPRYRQREEPLDVVNYVLAPNCVNTFGEHEGTLYQIVSKKLEEERESILLSKTPFFSFEGVGSYLVKKSGIGRALRDHGYEQFVNGFQPQESSGEIEKMLKFCLITTHFKDFFLDAFSDRNNGFEQQDSTIEAWPNIPWDTLFKEVSLTTFFKESALIILGQPPSMRDIVNFSLEKGVASNRMLGILENYQRGKKENNDAFSLRYGVGYKPRPFNPNQINMVNISRKEQELFRYFQLLRRDGEEPLKAFAKKVAKEIGVSDNELVSLCEITMQGREYSSPTHNALEIRRVSTMLLRAFPNLVTERFNYQKYISFARRLYPRLHAENMRMYPPRRHSDIGREAIVNELDRVFSEGTHVVYLHGPQGSGKSEVAVQYCEKFEKTPEGRNAFIVFFDASNLENLKQEWLQFAVSCLGVKYDYFSELGNPREAISPRNAIQDALNILEASDSAYLLVFNGADPALLKDIKDYFPPNSTGQILVTTPGPIVDADPLHIDLDQEEYHITDSELSKLFPSESQSFTGDQRNQVFARVKTFPLLARLVGKRLQTETPIDFTELIELVGNRLENVIKESINAAIAESRAEGTEPPLSDRFLTALAVCSSEEITKKTLNTWIIDEPNTLSRYIEQFENYGILQRKENNTFFIHPLIQRNIVDRIKQADRIGQMDIQKILLQFLKNSQNSSNDNMNNIAFSDYKRNKALRSRLAPLLNDWLDEEQASSAFAVMALNAVGNNALQSELYFQSYQFFNRAKRCCKEKAGVENDSQVVEALEQNAPEFIAPYANALHYLGKIHFQIGDKRKSKNYFDGAIEVNKKSRAPKKDIHGRIFKRQGLGWLHLASNDPNRWREALRLYRGLHSEDSYSFNRYYCNLQLARAHCKLAENEPASPSHRREHYGKALERLQFGGSYQETPFKSALTCIYGRNYKDAEPEILLEIGKILGDRSNPYYDFLKAEQMLFQVLQMEKNPSAKDKQLRTTRLFKTYASLAKLYSGQINTHYYTEQICSLENEGYSQQAQGCAFQALACLRRAPAETVSMLRNQRQQEIQEMEKLAGGIVPSYWLTQETLSEGSESKERKDIAGVF